MSIKLPLILSAAAGLAFTATAALADGYQPAAAKGQTYWAGTEWDDDDDDRRRYGAMPVPNANALKRVGLVKIKEVERDDGYIEVEGYNARGEEVEVRMDARGQRVLSVDRDD